MSLAEEIVSNMLKCMSFIILSYHCPVSSLPKKGTRCSRLFMFFS